MKILFVDVDRDTDNGGYFVAQRNLKALKHIAGEDNVSVALAPHPTMCTVLMSLLSSTSYGMTRKLENEILRQATQGKYDLVFIDITLFGMLARRLHRRGIKTIAFAHNVETEFYRQLLHTRRSLARTAQYFYVRYCEKLTTKYATSIIVLNQRDASNLSRLFGRTADAVMPITFPDAPVDIQPVSFSRPYCLFVGSNFPPNVEGITWFIQNVATHISYDVRIVGSCCNSPELKGMQMPANVFLEGFVDDLSAYYHSASFVIAPIFSGSGMKTKTIEALSYGKSIIGTKEAFEGIDGDTDKIGGVCESANEYIQCISSNDFSITNEYSLQVFKSNHTDDAFLNSLKQFVMSNFI